MSTFLQFSDDIYDRMVIGLVSWNARDDFQKWDAHKKEIHSLPRTTKWLDLEAVTEICRRNGYMQGNWFFYIEPEDIKSTWSALCKSFVNGRFGDNCYACLKTSPKNGADCKMRNYCILLIRID